MISDVSFDKNLIFDMSKKLQFTRVTFHFFCDPSSETKRTTCVNVNLVLTTFSPALTLSKLSLNFFCASSTSLYKSQPVTKPQKQPHHINFQHLDLLLFTSTINPQPQTIPLFFTNTRTQTYKP